MGEHLVFCGGTRTDPPDPPNALRLNASGPDANVTVRLYDFSRHFVKDVPALLTDLLEVAAYVYAADGAFRRGGDQLQGMGKDWRRKFRFVVPVRCPEVWQLLEISDALANVLGFLSDDDYAFKFVPHLDPPEFTTYLDLEGEGQTGFTPDKVLLFSGGLDSLAGAVEELAANRSKVLLVSHHSAAKTVSRQKELAAALRERFPGQVMHVPVKVQKANTRTSEFTLRSRSFLFAALATVASKMTGAQSISFYENGIVSLNLPLAAQIVGARATRTTHPRTLAGFSKLLSLLLHEDFAVENPFLWRTKADVVSVVAMHGCEDLIRRSVSCSHVREITNYKTHCGACSQCIDRRFGTLGAGMDDFDPEEGYAIRLFQDAREKPRDRDVAFLYVKSALESSVASDEAFFRKFAGEISQSIRFLPGKQDETAKRIIDLHRRHADGVRRVLENGIKVFASDFLNGRLPETSLLKVVTSSTGTLGLPEPRHSSDDSPEGEPDKDVSFDWPAEIRVAIDEQKKTVLFQDLPALTGDKTSQLFKCLADKRTDDMMKGKAPENYGGVRASKIADHLGSDEQAVRKSISRIRKQFARSYVDHYGFVINQNALIETCSWNGYRLHRNVLLLAPSELAPVRGKLSTEQPNTANRIGL